MKLRTNLDKVLSWLKRRKVRQAIRINRVIITGMFRSGTTHLWKLLSADPSFCISYCEPLHPRLNQEIRMWSHYRAYEARIQVVQKYWKPAFNSEQLFLGPEGSYPELAAYLRELLIPGALAKFVRLNLRLGWFARKFPDVFVVVIVRDPRAVCFSMLHHPGSDRIARHDIPWEDWHGKEYFDLYSRMPAYRDYLAALAHEPPYVKILALWQINVETSLHDLETHVRHGILVRYEDLCLSPEQELSRIYRAMDSPVPQEVLEAVNMAAGTERPWQAPTHGRSVAMFRQVDDAIWQEGIRRAGIGDCMKRLGY